MNVTLLLIGKTAENYLQTGIDIYVDRLQHYTRFSIEVVPALRDVRNATPAEVKLKEGQLLLKHMAKADRVVLLDERGRSYTSVGFAERLQQHMNGGVRHLMFVVGGAYGFSPDVYQAASERMSLSTLTFNHQMVRLFFVEQLYRAFTILRNEKYHKE